jgi:hypothetical protein
MASIKFESFPKRYTLLAKLPVNATIILNIHPLIEFMPTILKHNRIQIKSYLVTTDNRPLTTYPEFLKIFKK